MKNTLRLFFTLFLGIFSADFAYTQEIISPSFKNGDWWIMTLERSTEGLSRSGACYESYEKYLVKIVGDKQKVFVGNNLDQEIECEEISDRLLGSITKTRLHIPFPLTINSEKMFDTEKFPWETVTAKAYSRTSFKLAGKENKEIDAVLISRTARPRGKNAAFDDKLIYSQECKCVLDFNRTRSNEKTGVLVTQKQTVINYEIAP